MYVSMHVCVHCSASVLRIYVYVCRHVDTYAVLCTYDEIMFVCMKVSVKVQTASFMTVKNVQNV